MMHARERELHNAEALAARADRQRGWWRRWGDSDLERKPVAQLETGSRGRRDMTGAGSGKSAA